MGEFELIERWFQRKARRVALGNGDDCALIEPAPGHQLAISCDMLVEGRHFLSTVPPARLGHKALAVNLSDLAACGARPLAFSLALSLPRIDETWLAGFADGLWALADRHDVDLVGGDTTAGPLNIAITVYGEVPAGQALLRSGARPKDRIWVSGHLGDARLALEVFRGALGLSAEAFESVRLAMECPEPRVALGLALRRVATSAIDLSDGLLGDLAHVLRRSGVGAVIDEAALPCSAWLARQAPALRRLCALSGGDDYELLFTAPPDADARVREAARAAGVRVSAIGVVRAETGLEVRGADGQRVDLEGLQAFDHFRP